jgi:hypothetical protein
VIALISLGILLLPIVLLAIFAFAALRWGVDSRDRSADPLRPGGRFGIS